MAEVTEEEIWKIQEKLFKRICPIREVPCHERDCAWWDSDSNCCSIKAIANAFKKVIVIQVRK